jgi:GNAT superfamily N-acetyltransferase
MTQPWMLEAIGYVASVLVAISLMMSSILRLRVINLLGSITFTVYGLLIQAHPVAAVNLFIVFINLYYLRGMLRTREYFRLLEVEPASEYLRCFLDFYRQEIGRTMPGFAYTPGEAELTLFVLRDMVPAGVVIGEVRGDTLRVQLDFVPPRYRDFKIGRFLFEEQVGFFRSRGIRQIESDPGSREHVEYLRRMGFGPAATATGERYLYRLPDR